MRIKACVAIITISSLLLLTACMDVLRKPFEQTIEGSFQIYWDSYTGLNSDILFTDQLKAKYPKAKFVLSYFGRRPLYKDQGEGDIENYHTLVEENRPGDLVLFESTLAPYLFRSGYLEPLDAYIDTDPSMSGLVPQVILDHIREQGNGQIFGLPLGKEVYALYYNLDLFREWGLPKPRDGMTWEEVFELARTIEEQSLGVDQAALALQDYNLIFSQRQLRYVDPATGNPDFDNPVWDSVFPLLREIDAHHKHVKYEAEFGTSGYQQFFKKRVGMVAGRLHGSKAIAWRYPTLPFSIPVGAQWDLVSFPVFADAPAIGPAPAYYYLGVVKNSTRKKDTYQLISHLLSDEVQLANSQNGLASVRSNADINSHFGERNHQLLGKNVGAYFYHSEEGSYGPEFDVYYQTENHFAFRAYPSFFETEERLKERFQVIAGEIREANQTELSKVASLQKDP